MYCTHQIGSKHWSRYQPEEVGGAGPTRPAGVLGQGGKKTIIRERSDNQCQWFLTFVVHSFKQLRYMGNWGSRGIYQNDKLSLPGLPGIWSHCTSFEPAAGIKTVGHCLAMKLSVLHLQWEIGFHGPSPEGYKYHRKNCMSIV